MDMYFLNIKTLEELTCEDFNLLVWEKSKIRYEKFCGKSWDGLDDRSKAIATSVVIKELLIENWRTIYKY